MTYVFVAVLSTILVTEAFIGVAIWRYVRSLFTNDEWYGHP